MQLASNRDIIRCCNVQFRYFCMYFQPSVWVRKSEGIAVNYLTNYYDNKFNNLMEIIIKNNDMVIVKHLIVSDCPTT